MLNIKTNLVYFCTSYYVESFFMKKKKNKDSAKKNMNGFLLIEILVSLAMISILGTVAATGVIKIMEVRNDRNTKSLLYDINTLYRAHYESNGEKLADLDLLAYQLKQGVPVKDMWGNEILLIADPIIDGHSYDAIVISSGANMEINSIDEHDNIVLSENDIFSIIDLEDLRIQKKREIKNDIEKFINAYISLYDTEGVTGSMKNNVNWVDLYPYYTHFDYSGDVPLDPFGNEYVGTFGDGGGGGDVAQGGYFQVYTNPGIETELGSSITKHVKSHQLDNTIRGLTQERVNKANQAYIMYETINGSALACSPPDDCIITLVEEDLLKGYNAYDAWGDLLIYNTSTFESVNN